MPKLPPEAEPRILRRVPLALLGREAARIAAAFVVYLGLRQVWSWLGLQEIYSSLVVGLASSIFVPTQHFPVVPNLDNMTLRQLDFITMFAVSLGVVSIGVPWKKRLRRFSTLLVVIYLLHVATAILQVKVISAVELSRNFDLVVLLPWEFKLVERTKYLLFDLGMQWQPFLLALLAVAWNAGFELPRRAPDPGRRRRYALAGLGAVIVVVLGLAGWSTWRESQPLHVGAHASLGYLYHRNENFVDAEHQYRIAIRGGDESPQLYYNLAIVLSRQGNNNAALEQLRKGRELTNDPEWRQELEKAITTLTP